MSAESRLELAAVALDLGNVLVRVDHGRFCRSLAPLVGAPAEKVEAAVFDSSLEPAYDGGRLTSREFHRQVMAQFGSTLPYRRFAALWNDVFDPMPGMEEVVTRLARRYPLYLVSNTNPLHDRYIRPRLPLLRLFRRLILSFRVGSRKPEPAFYQALRRAAGPPAGCLFVDDKLPYVEVARRLGFPAWHFISPEELRERLSREGLW